MWIFDRIAVKYALFVFEDGVHLAFERLLSTVNSPILGAQSAFIPPLFMFEIVNPDSHFPIDMTVQVQHLLSHTDQVHLHRLSRPVQVSCEQCQCHSLESLQ